MSNQGEKKTVSYLGNAYEGVVVDISEAKEPFGEFHLADGAVLKTKTTALEVVRVDSQRDAQGNPLYIINFGNMFLVAKQPDISNE